MTKEKFFTQNVAIILKHELKLKKDGIGKYKYFIEYGIPKRMKYFKTKHEAYEWIKKNKKYFPPTGVYRRREEPEWLRRIS